MMVTTRHESNGYGGMLMSVKQAMLVGKVPCGVEPSRRFQDFSLLLTFSWI